MSLFTQISMSSLQHSTMMEIASSIWSYRLTHHDSANVDELFTPFEPCNSIPLPNCMMQRAKTYVDIMGIEINRWMISHNLNLFPGKEKIDMLRYTKNLVWRSNATIDYYATAEALLKAEYLSDQEKLEFAKGYFFMEYIEKKCPNLSNDALKAIIQPLTVFLVMVDASSNSTRNQLRAIHKRSEKLLNWYFADNLDRIIAYKSSKMKSYINTDDTDRVRYILNGYVYQFFI